MIDWHQIATLKEDIGADSFEEVIEVFLTEVDAGVAAFGQTSDATALAEQLHALKGSALFLGFNEFSALCTAGEKLVNAGRPEAVDIAHLARVYETSRAMFLAGMDQREGRLAM